MAKIYDEVLNKANIRDVLTAYGLQIVGNKCICPFHDDRNPSMVINDKKQYVKCFSCGSGGNAVTFVYKYEREINHKDISISEAIRKVVDICHLDIDLSALEKQSNDHQYESNGYRYNERDKELLETAHFVKDLSIYNLRTSLADSDAKRYMISRDFNEDLIEYEGFGCLSKGQLLSSLGKRKELSEDRLVELGLLRYGTDGSLYEVFGDRVLIPIHDEKGNVVSFSGRAIHGEEPKYLHGKNSSVFHRSDILYNYDKAKNYAYEDELFIVEGFMDVAGGNRMGIHNIVATMGVEVSDKQLDLIKKNKSSITLLRDNDLPGREALLKEIPLLLNKGYEVNAVDLSSFPEKYDLWDIAVQGYTRTDIEKSKVNGFEYILKYKYFDKAEISTDSIYHVFQKVKNEGLIKNTLDEERYIDYVISSNPIYTRDSVSKIIHPKNIEKIDDPRTLLRDRLEKEYLATSIEDYLKNKDDKVLKLYYKLYKQDVINQIHSNFAENPKKYLVNEVLNAPLLLYDHLIDNAEFEKFEQSNRFYHENVFNQVFIKNRNGEGRIILTQPQMTAVIEQYKTSLSDDDKKALEDVEELYIVNDTNDLDGILDIRNNKDLLLLKERIKIQMKVNSGGKMMYFKYGNIFREEDKPAISDKYKASNGEYKTILFYNNLNNNLKLSKNQIITKKQHEVSQIRDFSKSKTTRDEKNLERDIDKDIFQFSVHKSLIQKETDSEYFIRIPGTKMRNFAFFPKDEVNWTNNNELLFATLSADETYRIYDKNEKPVAKWSYEMMKGKWEDKTKTNHYAERSEKKYFTPKQERNTDVNDRYKNDMDERELI